MSIVIPWIMVACWVVFILYWVISAFGVKRDVRTSPWRRWWWLRIAAICIVFGWLWGTSRWGKALHYVGFFSGPTREILAPIGALLTILGIGIAIWARVHLGRNWSPVPTLKEEHELVTSGPYKLIRHPIYTGILLAAFGSAIVTPTWLIVFVIILVMFVWRVHVEERLMLQQFPTQYPEYKKRTWALIPYVW
ncbi:MAG TPA: isoprenylcysteine carboxylmethyltransferase family protein [Candidatus Paceibacterota bacterium]|nr:isoprenylcysteine carboxylmethyltransferase family protein [Candidatus Paceibacterota bacterium]